MDPCQLLKQADAEAVAQTKLGPPHEGSASSPSCTYKSMSAGARMQVSIFLGAGAKALFDTDHRLGHTFRTVSGVSADEAWEEANAVFFRKGSFWIAIQLIGVNDPAVNRLPLEHLMKIVALRLS